MKLVASRNDLVSQSSAAAESAARSAGLAITDIDDLATLAEISRLFDTVWSSPDEAPLISASTLKAISHAGNYIAAAFHDDAIVGGIVGFLGYHEREVRLHSHILGVSPQVQGRSIGYALKLHQRAWALERGIRTVTWTFDPLVRRNAYFNLTKLGAVITEYYENFYGPMPDGINAGQESDRVLVEWSLDSPAVIQASDGAALEPDVDVLRKDGAVTLLSASEDGMPAATNTAPTGTLLVQVPPDIVTIRDKEPDLARLWRRETRAALGTALAKGFVGQGMTRSGWYVLSNGYSGRA